jgi:hypothetical protein
MASWSVSGIFCNVVRKGRRIYKREHKETINILGNDTQMGRGNYKGNKEREGSYLGKKLRKIVCKESQESW